MSTIYGTDNQHHYVGILRTRLGTEKVDAATRKVLGLDVTAPLPERVASEATSSIIDLLKELLPPGKGAGSSRKAAGQETRATRLTGRELLGLASLEVAVPADLDPEMATVVARLRKLNKLQALLAGSAMDAPQAVNGREPILVSQLVQLLGTASAAAKALGVTLKTLEGWGEFLPESHESRAELATFGAVKARLPA